MGGFLYYLFDYFPALFLAAVSVFLSNIVMVMGPTPPGTGVMAEAIGSTDAKSTSPVSLPSARRFMPTSMTTAPGFTISAVTKSALPMATTKISAWRVISERFFVRLWHTVTVPFAWSSNIAIGLPTMLADLPMLRTYINAYDSDASTMEKLVEKLLKGPDAFKGKDPIDSFCGLFDTKI